MRFAVYLPLVLSVLIAPPLVTAGIRRLPDRLHPRSALGLLVTALVGLAVASTASLALLVVGGVAEWRVGPVTTAGGHANPGGLVAGALAAVALAVAVARWGVTCWRTVRRRRSVHRRLPAAGDGPWIVDDDAVYALAAPRSGGRAGRVVLSRGLLEELDPVEREAVVAHEREHLDGRHHRYLVVAAIATALNPGLTPLRRDLGYALERCADEAAAEHVDDRAVVARAIGRAALASRRRPAALRATERSLGLDAALMLGATGGPVPRRVSALLSATPGVVGPVPGTPSPATPAGWRSTALVLLVAATVLAATGLALLGALHAAVDLADILRAR